MRTSILFCAQTHVSSLAGTIYKKLEDLVSSGNTEFKVLSAWETFSSWACRLENKYCLTKAQEYFNKWQAGEKSVTILLYYILAP